MAHCTNMKEKMMKQLTAAERRHRRVRDKDWDLSYLGCIFRLLCEGCTFQNKGSLLASVVPWTTFIAWNPWNLSIPQKVLYSEKRMCRFWKYSKHQENGSFKNCSLKWFFGDPKMVLLWLRYESSMLVLLFVTLDHKTSHKDRFFWNWNLYIIWKLNK